MSMVQAMIGEAEKERIKLAPSVLAADFSRLGEEVKQVVEAGADYIHLDVMDGHFVPNISLGIPVVQCLRKVTDVPFDVHLMVEDPIKLIGEFARVGADMISVHVESSSSIERAIIAIRNSGCRACVVLNPTTPIEAVEPILEKVDMVLLMTVNPGSGGQKYIESSTEKIRTLRRMIDERGLLTDIQVDGGITTQNVSTVIEAGANVIVAGSSVFRGDSKENVKTFKEIFKRYHEE